MKKTEENKKSFTSPKEKSNQNIQSIHNEEQHLIYSALIRPKIEVLKPNPEKEQTISKLEQSFPDLNKNVKNNDLLINNLKLDKILYPTKKENGRLSENFSSIQLELPSKSLHEKSSNEESIDIGQIDPSLCKKKSRSEEIVDYTNQFLIKMLEMKLLREESNSSMSVEVYAEDVNNFLADINYDMQEIFKRGSIEKESFLKIHDRSGLDEMDHCESHTNSKNENQSDESTRRDHEKHDEEIDNKTKEDNISEKDIKTNNKILEDQKKINDEEIKKKSNLNEKSKQKDNIIIKEDYINKGFTSMENDKKIVNLIDEGNTTKVIMIDQEVTKNIVEEVKKTKKVFENEKKILNKNKKQKFTVKSNDDIPNKKKLKEIPVKKEPEFKKLKLKEIPLRKTNEKQKNNIYNSEKLKLAVNISEEKNDILKEIISVPYTIDELSKEKNGIFTNEKKESKLVY